MKKYYDVSFPYQLNCNSTHDMFFYIELFHSNAKIKLYEIVDGLSKFYKEVKLKIHPISCGWLGKDIFLLSEKELNLYDIEKNIFKCMLLPQYKIVDILCLRKKYLYSSMIETEYIHIYQKNTVDKLMASFSVTINDFVFISPDISLNDKKSIKLYIDKFKSRRGKNACDILDVHTLEIRENDLKSALYLDKEEILEVFGHVDRAIFLGKEIVYTFSAFNAPQQIHTIKLESCSRLEKIQKINMNIDIRYNQDEELNIPHYKLISNQKQTGTVIMFHGGPFYRYVNTYYPIIPVLLEVGISIYLINYTGSSGYNLKYQEKLYGNGGKYDYYDIKKCIEVIGEKYKKFPLFVIGDSYGGYLTLLAYVKGEAGVAKYYATNAFTDIRYQYLFSNARAIIKKCFSDITSQKIRNINPIDLASKIKSVSNLMIINGSNDPSCPVEQILQFQKITNCEVKILSDYPHYKVDYLEQKNIDKYIVEDIKEIINA